MFHTIHEVALMIDRALADRAVEPSAAILDSQTVEAPPAGAEPGYDGAKKTVGRKRHIAVDTAASGAGAVEMMDNAAALTTSPQQQQTTVSLAA